MKKFILFSLLIIILGVSSYFLFFNKKKEVIFTPNIHNVSVNTEHTVKEFVQILENGTLKNGDDLIDTSRVGVQNITFVIENLYQEIINEKIEINIIDEEVPVIEGVKDLTTDYGKKIDLLKDIKVTDNSLEEITPVIEGKYDVNKAGTYNLSVIAKDGSDNETKEEFKLVVKEKKVTKVTINKDKSKYYVKINKKLNVVMVYSKDDNGEYTKLVKTFVASAGNNTPIGKFKATDRYETLGLVGGVWGHYTLRIKNAIFFHSVPYFTKPTKSNPHWDNLEYEEYNKLGNLASKGCVRLAVIDAKWLYENIAYGTTIEIYEDDTLPEGVTKPTPIKIDVNSPNKGWDPTDPDSENPWNN